MNARARSVKRNRGMFNAVRQSFTIFATQGEVVVNCTKLNKSFDIIYRMVNARKLSVAVAAAAAAATQQTM